MTTFSFSGGTDLDADKFNDNLGCTWSTYTPSWSTSGTQPAIGNGKLKGRWARVGNILFARIEMLAGSTTTFGTNQWNFGLPPGLTGYYDTDFNPWPPPVGVWNSRDVAGSPAYYKGFVLLNASPTSVTLHTTTAGVTNVSPSTWAQNDWLGLEFTVELV